MADVRTTAGTARDRGQMLLVAAFGVAVMLVALALILNTAIYTENIATRGSDISGGKDALRYRAVTEDAIEGAIRYVNVHNNSTAHTGSTEYAHLEQNMTRSVWNYSNMSGRLQATDSIVANVTVKNLPSSNAHAHGTHIYQGMDANFSDEDGTEWEVATNSQGVRRFRINATDENGVLAQLNKDSASDGDSVFYVQLAGTTRTYRVFIYEKDGNNNRFIVEVRTAGGGDVGLCERKYETIGGEPRARVNLTNASAAGQPCGALKEWWSIVDEDMTVSFKQPCFDAGIFDCNTASGTDVIEGQYTLIVNETLSSVGGDIDHGTTGADDTINADRVIYSSIVHVTYESRRLYYETDVRAAPGEPDA